MCFSPRVPDPKPLPVRPAVDDDAVRARQAREEARLQQQSGRASTVVSDLRPSDIQGQRRVLLGV